MIWKITASSPANRYWHLSNTENSISLEFIETKDGEPNTHYQTVLIDLPKWDEYWEQDICNFVPANLNQLPKTCCKSDADYQTELAMHRQKIQRWQDEVPKTGKIPAVCFEKALLENRLKIKQGRHRIAYLRQLKLPAFPASIPENLVSNFAENHLLFRF